MCVIQCFIHQGPDNSARDLSLVKTAIDHRQTDEERRYCKTEHYKYQEWAHRLKKYSNYTQHER